MKTALHPPLLDTYARQNVTFVRGDGSWLVDVDGRRYLDLLAGLAVVGLGHCHPAPLAAATAQLAELWHVSNLYWTRPMQELAERLSARFGGARAFFGNSGAEAVEAALKWARKATGRSGFVALDDSFHGRTFGALSVTGQPGKQAPFAPLVPGVRFVRRDDPAALADAVDGETAAILLEPIQGEGGVHPLPPDLLSTARELADRHGALLVLDEIQTGVGRTGTFFAWEQLGPKPHAVCLAKGLANGLPIGVLLVSDDAPAGFEPGDHGSTFGANPVACAAACAVVDHVTDELLAGVTRSGGAHPPAVAAHPARHSVRGRGRQRRAPPDPPPADVVAACLERGVVVGSAGPNVLRLTPPLTIADDELAHGLSILQEVLL